MSKKKAAEDEVFFNPFQGLRQDLGKKAPAAPPEKPALKAAPAKSARSASPDPVLPEDDAALFLQAVSAPSFVPLKDARPVENWGSLHKQLASKADQSGGAEAGPLNDPPSARPAGTVAAAKAGGTSGTGGTSRTGKPVQTAPEPEPLSEAEAGLFASAMRGVQPVDGKGRDLPLPAKPEVRVNLLEDPDYLQDFLEGKVEFSLEYTDEFFEGHVTGLDPLVLAKLRSGQYSPESHIDLHGQNADQALEALITFVRHAYNKGQRSLVVVTGRGKNSPGGLGVLRQNMQDWLTRDPLKRVVLAFCTSQPKDGGAGAIYVLLRKYKKRGKIRWDLVR